MRMVTTPPPIWRLAVTGRLDIPFLRFPIFFFQSFFLIQKLVYTLTVLPSFCKNLSDDLSKKKN